MKTTVNGLTITHPDLGFAFNPISLEIEGFKNTNYLIFKSGEFTIQKDRYQYSSSSITFELSGIARSLFDRSQFHKVKKDDNTLYKELKFEIVSPSDNATVYSGVIPVIWGALQIGETYTQSKTLTYFPGYPFTVPLLVAENDIHIDANVDDTGFGSYEYLSSSSTKKYNLYLSDLEPDSKVTFRTRKEETRKIFDYSFDSTFRPQKVDICNDLEIVVNVADCPSEGIYLRWINQYGEYNYYLFGVGDQSTVTKDKSVVLDNILTTTSLTDNYHFGSGKPLGKDIERTTKLYAPLVDDNTFKLLLGLVKSPVVDLFVGYNGDSDQWINVAIQAGTFAQASNSLRDFECVLIPNQEQIQLL